MLPDRLMMLLLPGVRMPELIYRRVPVLLFLGSGIPDVLHRRFVARRVIRAVIAAIIVTSGYLAKLL